MLLAMSQPQRARWHDAPKVSGVAAIGRGVCTEAAQPLFERKPLRDEGLAISFLDGSEKDLQVVYVAVEAGVDVEAGRYGKFLNLHAHHAGLIGVDNTHNGKRPGSEVLDSLLDCGAPEVPVVIVQVEDATRLEGALGVSEVSGAVIDVLKDAEGNDDICRHVSRLIDHNGVQAAERGPCFVGSFCGRFVSDEADARMVTKDGGPVATVAASIVEDNKIARHGEDFVGDLRFSGIAEPVHAAKSTGRCAAMNNCGKADR
jgi:hypothetical protein